MTIHHTVLLASALLAGAPAITLAADAADQVTEAYSSWDAAFNSGDAKAVAAFYTEDATLLPPTHQVIEGPAGVEEFFAGLFAGGVTGHELQLIKTSEGEEMVVGAANWSARGKDENGEVATFEGIATHVFARQSDGSLKLMLHTFN